MASSIVKSAAKQLGTLVVQEVKFLYEVSDKIKHLQGELEWMQCFLVDTDNRQHQEEIVLKWVGEIRNIAYEAEDCIERYVHEVSHPRQKGKWNTLKWVSCLFSDGLTLHDIGSSMDTLSSKITKLVSRLQMYGIRVIPQNHNSAYNIALWEQRRTFSHIEVETVGLEQHIKELVGKLTNDKVKVVGIAGVGGLGKTTLARKVYLDTNVKQHFNKFVWVYVSTNFDRRKVFEEILKGLDYSGKDLTNEELPKRICKVLKNERCLVLLDDMWTTEAWDILQPAFESLTNSTSKILITTRKLELVQHADREGYSHPLNILPDKQGWILLQQIMWPEKKNTVVDDVEAGMQKVGKEMVKHCNGLPLAIVALGGILSTKTTITEWEAVRNNISMYLSGGMSRVGGVDNVMAMLELSYIELPFYLKPCFMFMGCFPEDYEIFADRLYHLWEAEGLITIPTGITGVSLDDVAESYLDQLVNRSMVQVEKKRQDGSIVSCRLHDVMRDLCLHKCKEVNFLHIEDEINSEKVLDGSIVSTSIVSNKTRRCAIYLKNPYSSSGGEGYVLDTKDQDEDPYIRSVLARADYDGRQRYLESLLAFDDDDETRQGHKPLISPDLEKSFSLLRVIDLEDLVGIQIGFECEQITNFIHLRYLSLRGCGDIDMVKHIWIFNCKYLETLDLGFGYNVTSVVLINEFWKLEKLRHLYLPQRYVFGDDKKLCLELNQLKQMETLINFDVRRCEVKDLEKMENLRVISFTIEEDALEHLIKSPAVKNGRLKYLQALRINARVTKENPTILTSGLKSACVSELVILGGEHKVTFYDVNERGRIFPHTLMRLRIYDSEIEKECIKELEKLPHLEELSLLSMSIGGSKLSFSKESFKQLVYLTFVGMPEFEEWEVGKNALPNLRFLDVKMTGLRKIPTNLPSSIKIYCDSELVGSEKYQSMY